MLNPELSAAFPEADRRRLATESIVPGAVLYLRCLFTNPPKDKYVAILCVENPCLLFLVNSEINPFIASKSHMRICQVPLIAADYPFLKKDSWLDCAQVMDDFEKKDIVDQIAADTSRIVGALSPATRLAVRTAVQAARTIEPRYVREILQSLG